jgi:hypothetical protein
MEFSKLKPILAPTSSLHAWFHVINSSLSRLYELFIRNYIIKNVCPNPIRKMCRRTHRVHLKCAVKWALLCSERHLIYFECDPERHVCRTAISHNGTIIAQSLVMRPQSTLHLSLSACASHRNYTPRRTRTHTIIKITCMCISENAERRTTMKEMQRNPRCQQQLCCCALHYICERAATVHTHEIKGARAHFSR